MLAATVFETDVSILVHKGSINERLQAFQAA